MGAPVRVVVFDLGGVVVRICRSWEEACARAGIDVREPERFAQHMLRERRRELTNAYMSGLMSCSEYFTAIAEATDALYTAEEVRLIHDLWLIEEYPGIGDLIRRVNALPGIVTACLSNTNHAHWQALTIGAQRSPAIADLAVRLVSHELGAVKPDDAIYRGAERALGARAQEIVFFDDTPEHVEGARRCGWHAQQIDPLADTSTQIADHLREMSIALDPH